MRRKIQKGKTYIIYFIFALPYFSENCCYVKLNYDEKRYGNIFFLQYEKTKTTCAEKLTFPCNKSIK